DFRLEAGMPLWVYDFDGTVLEKRLVVPHRRNVACIGYRLIDARAPVRLELHPLVHFRSHDAPVDHPLRPETYGAREVDEGIEIDCHGGVLVLRIRRPADARFNMHPRVVSGLLYSAEASRGYASIGDRWSPGCFEIEMPRDEWVGIVAGEGMWLDLPGPEVGDHLRAAADRMAAILETAGAWAERGTAARLVAAADTFI